MDQDHSQFHSPNAFCGNAGPEEMKHIQDLIDKLTDRELKKLVEGCGINFAVNPDKLDTEDYERVIDEADREDFYRAYEAIINSRKK